MDYGPANSPFASEPRNPRHELRAVSRSLSLLRFHPSALHPRPRPPSRFPSRFLLSTLRIARGCFLSIFANRRDLKSKKQQPSPSPSFYQSFPPLGRRFLSLFLLYFFSSFMFPLKENLPCDPAKSARAFYVPDDPHGIVSRSSARGSGRRDGRRVH